VSDRTNRYKGCKRESSDRSSPMKNDNGKMERYTENRKKNDVKNIKKKQKRRKQYKLQRHIIQHKKNTIQRVSVCRNYTNFSLFFLM